MKAVKLRNEYLIIKGPNTTIKVVHGVNAEILKVQDVDVEVTSLYYGYTKEYRNHGILFTGSNNSLIQVWRIDLRDLEFVLIENIILDSKISLTIKTFNRIWVNQSLLVGVEEDGALRTLNFTAPPLPTIEPDEEKERTTTTTTITTTLLTTTIFENNSNASNTTYVDNSQALTQAVVIVGSVFAAGGAFGIANWIFFL